MVSWQGDRVSIQDSVAVSSSPSGRELRERYADALRSLTLGAMRMSGDTVMLGPLTLIRFGPPSVAASSVEWPVEGGLLARSAGGRWAIGSVDGEVRATLTGFAPRLPRALYVLSHLQVHKLFTRLYLLRVRGREPAPGTLATSEDRLRAATVDLALCFTLAGGARPGRRLRRTLAIAAVYHVACWSLGGRTLGGLVVRQRVVASDGSRLTFSQALVRIAAMPASWILRRPVHDEMAGSEVIVDA